MAAQKLTKPWLSSVECDAMVSVVRCATANVLGRTYPTIITPHRKIDRLFARLCSDPPSYGKLSSNIGTFFALDFRAIGHSTDVPTYAAHILDCFSDRSWGILRAHVAVTEAYNFCCNSTLLRSREWLSPWEMWKYYVFRPLDVFEVAFLNVCAASMFTSVEVFAQEVLESPDTRVAQSVLRFAQESHARGEAERRTEVPAALADAVARIRDRAQEHELSRKHGNLAIALGLYVQTGLYVISRSWLRYTVPDFLAIYAAHRQPRVARLLV